MKVIFMSGIESISGSTKSKNGKRLVFMHRRGDKPGHGHMYIRRQTDYQRRTPISDSEKAARSLFSRRAEYVKKLIDDGTCKTKKDAWAQAKQEIK